MPTQNKPAPKQDKNNKPQQDNKSKQGQQPKQDSKKR